MGIPVPLATIKPRIASVVTNPDNLNGIFVGKVLPYYTTIVFCQNESVKRFHLEELKSFAPVFLHEYIRPIRSCFCFSFDRLKRSLLLGESKRWVIISISEQK